MQTTRHRPRILYLVDALDHDYQSTVTQGVVKAARRYNIDLIVIVGGQMVFTNRHLEERGFIYELANPKDFDGIILLGTSLSSHEGRSAIAPLIIRFATLPTVSIGLDLGKGSTVLVDNAGGIQKITEHLMDVHDCKRFAFISGPENNSEAQIRLQSFRNTLASRNLRLPEEHLMMGSFTETSGEKAICQLIDEREVNVTELDAIVAANDSMAVGAMDELLRREIRVPADVAIVGFDDIEAARYAATPLTTIQQPLIMQGERAVQRIMALSNASGSDTITVTPKLVIRRSCGCGNVVDAPVLHTHQPTDPSETLSMIISRKRKDIEEDLATAAERGGVARGWEELLLDAVIDATTGKGTRGVTECIDQLVRNSIASGEGVHTWATVIAALDKHLSNMTNPGTDESAMVESILHRARIAMSETTEHFHASKVRELRNQNFAFSQAAIAMLTTLDAEPLMEAAATHLPKLGIDTGSIALFENRDAKAPKMKRFLVLDDKKRIRSDAPFETHLLAAPELMENRPHALVVEPLCFYEEPFGVAAMEYGPTEGAVYEQLGAFFSAAIKAIYLSEENQQHKRMTDQSPSLIDSLTGAYSMSHMKACFVQEISRAQHYQQPLSVILINMDDFSKLNKELGEDQGDRALGGIAATLKRVVTPMDIVARIVKDEFMVLMPDTSYESALAMANTIKRRLKLALAFEFHGLISASFGITTTKPPHDCDEETLTNEANQSLRLAKRKGKDQAIHWWNQRSHD